MVSSGHGFIQQIFSLSTHYMLGTTLNSKGLNKKHLQIRLIFTVKELGVWWGGQDK